MVNDKNNRVPGRKSARNLTAEEQAQVSAGAGTFIITGTHPHPQDVIRD